MLDIKFVRDNPDAVKENIKKKFQDAKLPLVDEVIEKDAQYRAALKEVEALKAARNKLSKANGPLFGQLKKCDDEAKKAQLQAQIDANNAAVKADDERRAQLEAAQTARFARENRQVISCGGGVVKDPANLRALHANGIVLFIDRPLEDLLVGGGRPLSTSPEALKTMEAQRRPLYLAAADAVIPNKTTPADAVTAAMEALDEIFSH